MNDDTIYYIAWHPEFGYATSSLSFHRDIVENWILGQERGLEGHDYLLKRVRLVDVTKEGEKNE